MPQRIEHQVIYHHELLGCKGIHHLQNGAYPATDAWQGRLLQDLVGTGQQMSDFACKDLKRLYQNHIIDQYLTYKPFFLEEGEK